MLEGYMQGREKLILADQERTHKAFLRANTSDGETKR
jgi:hypothetical protein